MEHFDRDVVYLWQLQPTVHVRCWWETTSILNLVLNGRKKNTDKTKETKRKHPRILDIFDYDNQADGKGNVINTTVENKREW